MGQSELAPQSAQPAQIPNREDRATFSMESVPAIYQQEWEISKSFQTSKSLDICSDMPSRAVSMGFQKVKVGLQYEHRYWTSEQKEQDGNINQLCYLYVIKALYDMGWTPEVGRALKAESFPIVSGFQKAFLHYLTYLEVENVLESNTHILKSMPPTAIEVDQEIKNLVEVQLKEYGAIEIIHAFGSQLAALLQGLVKGRYILFRRNKNGPTFAERYYQQTRFKFGMFQAPADIFISIARELCSAPRESGEGKCLRVLEVGSGTGNFAQEVLQKMTQLGIRFHYVFIDFSRSALARVEKKLGNFGGQLEFKVVNIEIDPLEQGLPPNYFDLVVGVHVFHAVETLKSTMANVGKLLRKGGILLMGEMEVSVREFDICFGTLDASWVIRDADLRPNHCTVRSQVWRKVLGHVGFENGEWHDVHLHERQISVMASRRVERYVENPMEREWIMIQTDSQNWIVSDFRARMKELGRNVILKEFSEIVSNAEQGRDAQTEVDKLMTPMKDKLEGVLFWYDKSHPQEIPDPESRQFLEPLLCVAKFLGSCEWKRVPKLHFISGRMRPSKTTTTSRHCDNALLQGFLRIFRVEMPHIHSKSIEIKYTDSIYTGLIYDSIFNEMWTDDDNETEIYIYNDSRLVRRLLPEKKEEKASKNTLEFPSSRYKIELPKFGNINDLRYVPKESLEFGKGLGDNQVEVAVKSASLSCKDAYAVRMHRRDCATRKPTIGQDFAGIVCGVGGQVIKWRVGDPVFGCSWNKSTITSHLVVNAEMIEKIPYNMTFNEAATLPSSFQIAWNCLVKLAGMQWKQGVLFHVSSGGVGQACLQLAKCMGLRIIGSPSNKKFMKFLKCGVRHEFDSEEHFVEPAKLAFTTWPPGRALERTEVRTHNVDMANLRIGNQIYVMKRLMKWLGDGSFKPLAYIKYPAAKIIDALLFRQKAQSISKVVVEMPEMDSQSGEAREPSLFNERGSYVITEGLGDFGFALAAWMVENGAKFIIFVDRYLPSVQAMRMIKELGAKRGAIVAAWDCDISDQVECYNLFKNWCQRDKSIPPIRGVHLCSRDLSDKQIVDQNWENFETVLVPKVNGAWNLHQATRDLPLEFFIVHTSTAGVFGNAGQSTYATGNCYMETLMKARRAIRLPGLLINWGHWKLGLASNLHFHFLEPFLIENELKALEKLRRGNAFSVVIGSLNFPGITDIFPKFEGTLFENIPENKELTMKRRTDLKKREENMPTLYELLEQKASEGDDEFSLKVKTELVKIRVTAVLRSLLGVNEVEPEDNLLDMGLDSLMTYKLIFKLQDELGPLTLGHLDKDEHDTIDKITSYLMSIFHKES